MLRGSSFLPLVGLVLVSCLSVGCLNKKKDEVAVEAAAPPPAAYPSTPAGYADTSQAPAPASVTPAASAPTSPQPPAFELREGETLVTYKIEFGDSLSKIATKYNTSVTRIKAANGMTSDKIFAGKTLQVPTAAPPGLAMNSSTPPPSTGEMASSGSYYGRSGSAPSTSTGSFGAGSPSPYPSATTPAPPISPTTTTSPSSTSYPRVPAPPIPPQTQQPAGAFPTPNLGTGTGIQFSE